MNTHHEHPHQRHNQHTQQSKLNQPRRVDPIRHIGYIGHIVNKDIHNKYPIRQPKYLPNRNIQTDVNRIPIMNTSSTTQPTYPTIKTESTRRVDPIRHIGYIGHIVNKDIHERYPKYNNPNISKEISELSR